jgi:NitT/TauT family transport system permease protein
MIALARVGRVALPVAALAAAIAAWWLAKIAFGFEAFVLPSPLQVAQSMWTERSFLPHETWVTLLETVEGFVLAIIVGIPVAVAIAYSTTLERSIYPLLVGLNAVPKLALAPILVLWMGFGTGPKVLMVLLICVFPIVLSTATGIKSTPRELQELIHALSASPWQAFRKVRFPAALPHIFVGLKVAVSLAVVGAVIGEFVGATHGLGYVIIASGQNADTPLAFASIVLLAIMSVTLFYLLVALERLLIPWANHQQ